MKIVQAHIAQRQRTFENHRSTPSFALLSEVYSAQSDTERCVFLLELESSSHILF